MLQSVFHPPIIDLFVCFLLLLLLLCCFVLFSLSSAEAPSVEKRREKRARTWKIKKKKTGPSEDDRKGPFSFLFPVSPARFRFPSAQLPRGLFPLSPFSSLPERRKRPLRMREFCFRSFFFVLVLFCFFFLEKRACSRYSIAKVMDLNPAEASIFFLCCHGPFSPGNG